MMHLKEVEYKLYDSFYKYKGNIVDIYTTEFNKSEHNLHTETETLLICYRMSQCDVSKDASVAVVTTE